MIFLIKLHFRGGVKTTEPEAKAEQSLKLMTSNAFRIQYDSASDPVYNQFSESGSASDSDKIFILRIEQMLNKNSDAVAF